MQVQTTQPNPTTTKLTITADQTELDEVKQQTLKSLSKEVKLPGFRNGKVPAAMVEKSVDQSMLQSQFLDNALNRLYGAALIQEQIRPVEQPKVTIKKFVPFTTLEFEAEVESIGAVELSDYEKLRMPKPPIKITDKDVDEVVDNLRTRLAEKTPVERAAKDTDEVWIDFEGRDAKTDEPIKGGDGKDYPLVLGSNTFIPGFEDNLVGTKAGEDKEFTIDFPKDYGVKALQGRKVTFRTAVTKVNEVVLPKVDDDFAAKVGPFKTVDEMKTDIRKQVTSEREYQNDRDYESEVLAKVTEESKVAVPKALVDEEVQRLEQEERQNLLYRGITWEENLERLGLSEDEYRTQNRPAAELRVKAGLVLADIAEKHKVQVTPDEVEIEVKLRKGQYTDAKMQAELDKADNKREIASRILSEKTIAILVGFASGKK